MSAGFVIERKLGSVLQYTLTKDEKGFVVLAIPVQDIVFTKWLKDHNGESFGGTIRVYTASVPELDYSNSALKLEKIYVRGYSALRENSKPCALSDEDMYAADQALKKCVEAFLEDKAAEEEKEKAVEEEKPTKERMHAVDELQQLRSMVEKQGALLEHLAVLLE